MYLFAKNVDKFYCQKGLKCIFVKILLKISIKCKMSNDLRWIWWIKCQNMKICNDNWIKITYRSSCWMKSDAFISMKMIFHPLENAISTGENNEVRETVKCDNSWNSLLARNINRFVSFCCSISHHFIFPWRFSTHFSNCWSFHFLTRFSFVDSMIFKYSLIVKPPFSLRTLNSNLHLIEDINDTS